MHTIRKVEAINFTSSFRKIVGEFENLSNSKKADLEEEKSRKEDLENKFQAISKVS